MKTFIAAMFLCLATMFAVPAFAENIVVPTVNINSASAAEIAETLKGIGNSKAEAIVAYREANGGFESVDQLAAVKGIGSSTVENNRERIVLE